MRNTIASMGRIRDGTLATQRAVGSLVVLGVQPGGEQVDPVAVAGEGSDLGLLPYQGAAVALRLPIQLRALRG
ncbi:MAG: hypothetical protein ACREN1_10480 [Candidatus Dormibacteria bacterium]